MSPRERVCRAFRLAYEQAGLTQEALAVAIGIRQATISKYARGETQPPLDVLEKVDQACGKPAGHVLRLAEYVAAEVDLETAILKFPAPLDPGERQALLGMFRALSARHTADGPVTPLPRTPGMTRAEANLQRATAEQQEQDDRNRPEVC